MPGKLRRWLPHAAILIFNMYVVFFLIDLVNTAMNFIDNGLTKGLLALLCALGVAISATLIRDARAEERRRAKRGKKRPALA